MTSFDDSIRHRFEMYDRATQSLADSKKRRNMSAIRATSWAAMAIVVAESTRNNVLPMPDALQHHQTFATINIGILAVATIPVLYMDQRTVNMKRSVVDAIEQGHNAIAEAAEAVGMIVPPLGNDATNH